MSVVAADFADTARLPALGDHFPAPIAVAREAKAACRRWVIEKRRQPVLDVTFGDD